MRLNGDSYRITGALYAIPLQNRQTAQTFADLLTKTAAQKAWKVIITGKYHSNLYGKAYPSTRTIQLHKKGENLGTLIHEMAHEDISEGHGPKYKLREECYTAIANHVLKSMKEVQKCNP